MTGRSDFKKAAPPKLGEAFNGTPFPGRLTYAHLPGGGLLGFDLNKLQLSDFRMMRDHYQINASLSVLTFMMHQMDWEIECENVKIRDHCQANMEKIWTRLIRAISQSFWAGYSPAVLQWENDMLTKTIQLTKIKDMLPEECSVHWKQVEGWAPPNYARPKIPVYDGIDVVGSAWPIPTENTFWYPLLMENGDWYGRKLLRPAFTPWFFSVMMHLFSNRYFERFGEPLPVGRAPYDDEIDINGKKVPGRDVMLSLIQNLRSRGAVVLPSERSAVGNDVQYDYDIEYLESQMRGADFERYLMRLDEEMSLALFTPLLMLRTADVGSYNLGTQHTLVYMQMLNALSGDAKEYIDSYILNRMVDYNFSPTSPRAKIKFRKLGDDRTEMVKALLQQLFANGTAKPDLDEMGAIAGLSLTEVKVVTANEDPEADPSAKAGTGDDSDPSSKNQGGGESKNSREVVAAMFARLEPQIAKAFRDGTFGTGAAPSVGYQRQLTDALVREGMTQFAADQRYGMIEAICRDVAESGINDQADVLKYLQKALEVAVEPAVSIS